MKSFGFIDDLSIRASYGENGNAPGESYTQYNTYSTFSWNYLDQATMYSKSIELANKKWETTIQKNIGINLIVFKNRLNIDVDFYKKRTEDLFFKNLKIPTKVKKPKRKNKIELQDDNAVRIKIVVSFP